MREYKVFDSEGNYRFSVLLPYTYLAICKIVCPSATEDIGWDPERNVRFETALIMTYMVGGKEAADKFKGWLEERGDGY